MGSLAYEIRETALTIETLTKNSYRDEFATNICACLDLRSSCTFNFTRRNWALCFWKFQNSCLTAAFSAIWSVRSCFRTWKFALFVEDLWEPAVPYCVILTKNHLNVTCRLWQLMLCGHEIRSLKPHWEIGWALRSTHGLKLSLLNANGTVLHTTVAAFILFYFVFYCFHTVFIATPSSSSTLVKNESRSVSYIHFKPLGYLTSLTCLDIKRNS